MAVSGNILRQTQSIRLIAEIFLFKIMERESTSFNRFRLIVLQRFENLCFENWILQFWVSMELFWIFETGICLIPKALGILEIMPN